MKRDKTKKNRTNEYDYLHISARIHALENRLLTRERMERMLDAGSAAEAAKVLTECGYEELPSPTPTGIEALLTRARQALFADLRGASPQAALVDVFCIKYDYHNLKTLLKAKATGADPEPLLVDAGRYGARTLREDFRKGELSGVSETFQTAAKRAGEVLSSTGDPQRADILLDRAYYAELRAAAEQAGSPFLDEYVRTCIDAANLRAAVRAHRMGQGPAFLREVLVEGGQVEPERLAAAGPGELPGLCSRTPLERAAELGGRAMEGGALTAFEKACDDAVTAVVRQARRVPFGEQPLVGYLYAREAELTSIRILLNGKLAGLDRATLEERLRESYA